MPANYGEPIKIYDFKKGLWTVDPAELMPDGATPDARNVWYDEKNALTKMPGTELVLTEANNEFSYGETYNLFAYCTPSGERRLIYQGLNSGGTAMSLWSLKRQASYPANIAMTDITPSSGLELYRKCYFTIYRGKLYLTNGTDNLKRWDGETWTEYHADEDEQFKYPTVFDGCLILGYSTFNPSRLIYSDQNECHMGEYYDNQIHWRDLPFAKGDYMTWLLPSPYGSLVIFGNNSIHEIQGSLYNDGDARYMVSGDKGTVDGSSVQVLGDKIIFAWKDGFYMIGNTSIGVSIEDQKLKTEAKVQPLTAEIRNFWNNYVTVPRDDEIVEIKWSGSELAMTLAFTSGGTKEPQVNDIITGATSGAYATITRISLSTGTWAGGDAVGTLYLRDWDGTEFQVENVNLGDGLSHTNIMTVPASTFTNDWQLEKCEFNKDAVVTTNPELINFKLHSTTPTLPTGQEQTGRDQWVSLYGSGKDQYWAQGFAMSVSVANEPIPDVLLLFMKETGNVTADTIDLSIVNGSGTSQLTVEEDEVYASCQLSGTDLHAIECAAFTTGGTYVPMIGDTVTGETSNETATIKDIFVTGGAWADGDAVGFLWVTGRSGTFTTGENLEMSGGVNATLAASTPQANANFYAISVGCWIKFKITYWDHPQNLYDGYTTARNVNYIMLKQSGGDSSNYLSWGYKETSDPYSWAQMNNSDPMTPTGQSTADYTFKYYGNYFYYTASDDVTVITESHNAAATLKNWNTVFVTTDSAVIKPISGTYHPSMGNRINAYLHLLYYNVSSDGTTWDGWVGIANGGQIEIGSTKAYIKYKMVFGNYSGVGHNDSIKLLGVRFSYVTQTLAERLISSCIREGRYWFTCKIVDGKVQPS